MRFEVLAPRSAELRLDDLPPAVRARLRRDDEIVATVLSAQGATLCASLRLVSKPAGRVMHLELACPSCGHSARVLRVGPDRELACLRCRPHRTARQRQRSTSWWRHLGGEQTDRLARMALRHGPPRLELMGQIAQELVRADRARLEALAPKLDAVQRLAVGGT